MKPVQIAIGIVSAFALAASASAGVVKTKTKSNQSNDRIQQGDFATELGAAFDGLDANKDGQLDSAEQAALALPPPSGADSLRGPAPKAAEVRFGSGSERTMHLIFSAQLDSDGNGLISRGEWLADGQAQFARADADHDGVLSQGEAARFGWNIKSTEAR